MPYANDSELESTREHVFDFNSTDFSWEELISTLHDMVNEYKKLAQSFEEAKARQTDSEGSKTKIDWE